MSLAMSQTLTGHVRAEDPPELLHSERRKPMSTDLFPSQHYAKAQGLYEQARRHYTGTKSTLAWHRNCEPEYKVGNETDKQRLIRLQRAASRLYDEVAAGRESINGLIAVNHEIEALLPHLLGRQAKRVQEMVYEIELDE